MDQLGRLKEGVKWMWALGDYAAVARLLEPCAIDLAKARVRVFSHVRGQVDLVKAVHGDEQDVLTARVRDPIMSRAPLLRPARGRSSPATRSTVAAVGYWETGRDLRDRY